MIVPALIASMFKINPNPTFECDVLISVPGSDNPQALRVTFRHKGLRDLEAWRAKATEKPSDSEYLDEVIAGWSGVFGPDEKPVPYSIESLAMLLDAYPSASVEIFIAYVRQLRDARAKN